MIMSENKARDDKYINKRQPYEIDYIINQYPVKDQAAVKKAIEKGDYQSHEELYKKLASKGIKKKS
jgi:hypothetical protein